MSVKRLRSRRVKRTNLRGWWKGLPFILLPFALLLLFARFETLRLNHEYKAIALTNRIRAVQDDMKQLRASEHDLKRFERMEAQAPRLRLVEPNPGQIVVVNPSAGPAASLPAAKVRAIDSGPPVRTVIFRFDAAPEAVAQPIHLTARRGVVESEDDLSLVN